MSNRNFSIRITIGNFLINNLRLNMKACPGGNYTLARAIITKLLL